MQKGALEALALFLLDLTYWCKIRMLLMCRVAIVRIDLPRERSLAGRSI